MCGESRCHALPYEHIGGPFDSRPSRFHAPAIFGLGLAPAEGERPIRVARTLEGAAEGGWGPTVRCRRSADGRPAPEVAMFCRTVRPVLTVLLTYITLGPHSAPLAAQTSAPGGREADLIERIVALAPALDSRRRDLSSFKVRYRLWGQNIASRVCVCQTRSAGVHGDARRGAPVRRGRTGYVHVWSVGGAQTPARWVVRGEPRRSGRSWHVGRLGILRSWQSEDSNCTGSSQHGKGC